MPQKILQDFDFRGNRILNISEPISGSQPATKNYVLSVTSAISSSLNSLINLNNGQDANQATQIVSLSGDAASQTTQIVALSGNAMSQATQILAISANGLNYTPLVASANISSSLQTQITNINFLDANQASQIASISANYAPIVTVASLSSSLQNQILTVNMLDANQAAQIASLSASNLVALALDVNQAAQISALSATNNTFVSSSVVSGLTGSLQNQITTNNNLDANQATQIAEISANFSNFTTLSSTANLTGSLYDQRIAVNDFLMGALTDKGTFSIATSVLNGGTVTLEVTAPTDISYSGAIICNTGTTNNATGKASITTFASNPMIKAGTSGEQQLFEWRVKVTTLSTSAIGFNVKSGLVDGSAVGDPTNGIFFKYSDNINGGRWVGVTRNASTNTIVNSSIPVVINTWYILRAIINPLGTNVYFYINGILIGSSVTNIPTVGMFLLSSIEKQTTIATSRSLMSDWVAYGVIR